jgi:hypothetical protein
MVDYSQPYMPNMLSNANALSTMQGLMDRQKQNDATLQATQAIGRGDYDAAEAAYRQAGLDQQAEATRAKSTNIKAGQFIAGGDYDAAAGVMLQGGYLDAGQKLSDKQREDVDHTMQLGAQIAQIPGLKPEQWAAFMAEAKKDGFDTTKFEDPTTGPALMAAYAGKVQEYNKELRAQSGVGASGKADPIARIQQAYAQMYPDKKPLSYLAARSLDTALASKTAGGSWLTGFKFDADGNPTEPVWDVPANTALATRQLAYNPLARYSAEMGKKAADVDAQNLGRNAQAVIMDRHTDLAAGLAGGWEEDDDKLTPAQLAQRRNFEASTGGIRGNVPKMWQLIAGEAQPDAATPEVVRELSAINQMMKAEATRLGTMGQGAVAESVRHEFDNVVGDFLTMPSTKTYLGVLRFTKRIMGEFKDVPEVGLARVQKLGSGGGHGHGTYQGTDQPSSAGNDPMGLFSGK